MLVKIRNYTGTVQLIQANDQTATDYRVQLAIEEDIIVLNKVKPNEIEIVKEDQ